jgi:hypothetical protein
MAFMLAISCALLLRLPRHLDSNIRPAARAGGEGDQVFHRLAEPRDGPDFFPHAGLRVGRLHDLGVQHARVGAAVARSFADRNHSVGVAAQGAVGVRFAGDVHQLRAHAAGQEEQAQEQGVEDGELTVEGFHGFTSPSACVCGIRRGAPSGSALPHQMVFPRMPYPQSGRQP